MGANANRKHKDTVFRDLFGSPERKGNALELYNALNGTDYADPDALELTTLDDVIYMNVKNDVSFLLGDEMVLWEHQSAPNPNMPLRGLLYFARLHSAHVERTGADVYRGSVVGLPAPRYVTFYIGSEDRPEREVLLLSGAYGGPGDVEVRCEVVNINPGFNEGVVAASPTLAGYVFFVTRVREYNLAQGMPLREAMGAAIDDCVAAGHLVDYLRERRAEVLDMSLLTEFDEERMRELDRREGYEQGVEGLSRRLRERGVDPSLIEEAVAAMRGRALGERDG